MEITVNLPGQGGIKTHYRTFGEGKPLLILHGWESNCERWIEVAEPLSKKGFEVIVPDLPGFGKSDVLAMPWNTNRYIAWLEGFIKEINLKDYHLLGHSFGGALASKMAVKYPQNVKKLFLVAAACVRHKTTKKKFLERIAKVVKLLYFLPYYNLFRKAVYKYIIRRSDYVYVRGLMRDTYMNVIGEDLSFHLPFIKVPTIVIWGDKDDMTPMEDGNFIAKQVKGSKLVVIPGAGHDLNRKQAEILIEKVLEACSY